MSQSPSTPTVGVNYLNGWRKVVQHLNDGKSWSGRERNCCFLNMDGQRFGNVSAVTGLDYIDDARATAVTDWDHDGKLDIWVTNRTGPRLRFLKNNFADRNFLAVKLTGQTCNKDAIGARVEVALSNNNHKFIKTVRAGDGFLAQSSKWLHFGLGNSDHVKQLLIRWPDGVTEQFTDVPTNQHYRIVQGDNVLEQFHRKETADLRPTTPNTLVEPEHTRIVILDRKKIPPIEFSLFDGSNLNLQELPNKPVLVTLWSNSCSTCIQELSDLAARATEFRQQGVDIVAIHVSNSIEELHEQENQTADSILREIQFPFVAGSANLTAVEGFDDLLKRSLQNHRQLSLPTSFLVDQDHNLAVVYIGRVSDERLLADVELLRTSDGVSVESSLPFSGRWHEAVPVLSTNEK